jgi:hypothetical protein
MGVESMIIEGYHEVYELSKKVRIYCGKLFVKTADRIFEEDIYILDDWGRLKMESKISEGMVIESYLIRYTYLCQIKWYEELIMNIRM